MSKNIDQHEIAADIIDDVSETTPTLSKKERAKAWAAAHPRATKIAKIGGLVGAGALALVALNALGGSEDSDDVEETDDEIELDLSDDNDDA